MATTKQDILVYANWLDEPSFMGTLSAIPVRGHLTWSFSYNKEWIRSQSQLILDPDLLLVGGPQFAARETNFGMFLDSMPDRWGRTLMQRRESFQSKEERKILNEIDFLLGVHDKTRMGALRFKTEENGPFLDHNNDFSVPPLSNLRELQMAVEKVELDDDAHEIREWLMILLTPGSSLGGARPKASVKDQNDNLWIAKFPSRNDEIDKGLWEFISWKLAKDAGIVVPDAQLLQISGKHHTFLSKRFDRRGARRIHIASAMTMTGRFEGQQGKPTPSYLELAEFIQFQGAQPELDLYQLWRRILFNITISNTDDHLRNHAFLLQDRGWTLSPAYDMNPSIDKMGLSLNIDMHSNALNFELLESVGELFNLSDSRMKEIKEEVFDVVSQWKVRAQEMGIPRSQIRLMETAFRV